MTADNWVNTDLDNGLSCEGAKPLHADLLPGVFCCIHISAIAQEMI